MSAHLRFALPTAFAVAVQSVAAQSAPTAPSAAAARVAAPSAVRTPAIGTRTRVTSPTLGERRVATVLGYRGDTLVVLPEGTRDSVAVALGDVSRLDVSVGRRTNVRKGLLIGFLSGAAIGAMAAAVAHEETRCSAEQWFCDANTIGRGGEALITGVVTGVVGAGLGAVVGAIWKTERWERTPLASPR